MSALSPRQHFLLSQACKPIREAFDSCPYLVGTALERDGHRDVDVRLILGDDRYDALYEAIGKRGVAFLGLAIGQYLASLTDLPIDFQIQRQTEANEQHDKPRSALGLATLANFAGDCKVSR